MKTRDEMDKSGDPRDAREQFWVSHYSYLAESGYQLRPRYHPDWKPSWLAGDPHRFFLDVEDWHFRFKCNVLDAVRISDGLPVALKRVSLATSELSMLRFLSWHPSTQSPLNHAVPLLQVLPVPDDPEIVIAVMPKLRECYTPYFHCRREVLECLRQIVEGVGFMHSLNVCHGDVCANNFVMDATEVCPQGFHFVRVDSIDGTGSDLVATPRCQCQVKYYIVDFETSQRFITGRHDASRGIHGTRCQIKTAPELSLENIVAETPYNPFRLDVYNIGATFESICDDYYEQLDDLRPFLGRLTAKEPSQRMTLEDAMAGLLEFTASRSEEWLNSRLRFLFVSADGRRYLSLISLADLPESTVT